MKLRTLFLATGAMVLLFLALLQFVHAATVTLQPGDTAVCAASPTPTATSTSTPTRTPTITPTPTPTATATSAVVAFTSPVDGATVSGQVTISVVVQHPPESWTNFLLDGNHMVSSPPYSFGWDTTTVANGPHTLGAQSKDTNGNIIGTDSVSVTVANTTTSATPTATPTAVATCVGTPAPQLTLTSAGVYDGTGKCVQNIVINGSNITVQNWDVSNQNNKTGIQVNGGSHIIIQTNYVHELCDEGIFVQPGVTDVQIRKNRVWHASMAGINLNGTNGVVDSNEVWETTQYPKTLGGRYASCSNNNGADADCLRWFGSGHTISNNYCHDNANDWGQPDNKDPHVDCIQTWGPLSNSRFTGNTCIWAPPGENINREFCEHEELNGTQTGGLTFDHNLFINGRDGCMFEAGVTGITATNNTFVGVLHESVNLRTSGNSLTNNLGYDSDPTGGDAMWCAPAGNTVTNNNRYNQSGKYGTYCSSYPETRLNPQFVNPGTTWTNYGAGDYHLKATSPVPGLGAFPLQ